jgi:hypothetical protein
VFIDTVTAPLPEPDTIPAAPFPDMADVSIDVNCSLPQEKLANARTAISNPEVINDIRFIIIMGLLFDFFVCTLVVLCSPFISK